MHLYDNSNKNLAKFFLIKKHVTNLVHFQDEIVFFYFIFKMKRSERKVISTDSPDQLLDLD